MKEERKKKVREEKEDEEGRTEQRDEGGRDTVHISISVQQVRKLSALSKVQ